MENITISFGSDIRQANLLLVRKSLSDIAAIIADPYSEVGKQVTYLRTVRNVDEKRYREMKTALPFVVCAQFAPAKRRKENFAYADCFIIDIDHVAESGADMTELRRRVEADPHVVLSFISPSGNGLKVMYRLKEACCDHGLYTIFYKKFATDLATRLSLSQMVDTRTCDVSRACFLSCDPSVYLNAGAEPVDMSNYVDFSNPADLLAASDSNTQNKTNMQNKSQLAPAAATTQPSAEPDAEALAIISERIAANRRPKPATTVQHVPQEVVALIPQLKEYFEKNYKIEIYETVDIQYGQKIHGRVGQTLGEIVLYHGKHKGFSVVVQPSGRFSEELNKSMKEITQMFLHEGY